MSLVYLTGYFPEAASLASSFQSYFHPVSNIIIRDQKPPATMICAQSEQKTLQEVLDINPFDFPRSGLACTVTISRLSPQQTWWFFSCNKCSRKSVPENGLYRCSSCPCQAAKPRYKLCVIATDGTADAEFILFGDIAQSVVGKHIGAILRSNRGGDIVPPEIAQIVCNKYTWHVALTEKSFHGPNKTF